MVNANNPPAHANSESENTDWDTLKKEDFHFKANSQRGIQDLSEKDMERLHRLQGWVEEMRANARALAPDRIQKSEDAINERERELRRIRQEVADKAEAGEIEMQQMNKEGTMTLGEEVEQVTRANLERKQEQIRDLIPRWIENGNEYIPSGRQAEWAEHVQHLVEEDPSGAEERMEKVLGLMQRLGDNRINLADLNDRASDEDIKRVADFFRKFEMTSPLSGTDLGGVRHQKVDENGNRLYDQYGFKVLGDEMHLVKVPLSDDDRGVLEDLLRYSPQGLRFFQEIYPERFWDEHDRVCVEEAKRRNATDFAEARKAAVESGKLDDIIRARQKRQGVMALSQWGGTEQAKKRIAKILEKWPNLKEGEKPEQEPGDYWERHVMGVSGVERDDIESTIEVLNALNNKAANVREAVRLLDDYGLSVDHRDFVRRQVACLHPRGAEFFRASRLKDLTEKDKRFLASAEKLNEENDEKNEPGKGVKQGEGHRLAGSRDNAGSEAETSKPEYTVITPEQMSKKNAERNAREAREAEQRIEVERRNLQEAEVKLARAREELEKFSILDRFNGNRLKYAGALDSVKRAEYERMVAQNNIAGAQNILERARRGEM